MRPAIVIQNPNAEPYKPELARITIEHWSTFHQAAKRVGVLYCDPAEARITIESSGFVIDEQILSKDGQRVWTLRRKR